MMKRWIMRLALIAVATMLNVSEGAARSGGNVAKVSREPKSILEEVQNKLDKAKTVSVTVQEEKDGIPIESKCAIRQFGKGVLSCRQELRALVPGAMTQPFVSVIDHNKLYFFPTGCGNVVVRMKWLETREPDSPLANLLFSGGKVERLADTDADCVIRYTCAPTEVKALKAAIGKRIGAEIPKDMTPAVLEYRISKRSLTLLGVIVYSERGKQISKQQFKDWRFDNDIPDSTFEIPKGFKQYVVTSAKEAEELQAELMHAALAEQAKRQQPKGQQKK